MDDKWGCSGGYRKWVQETLGAGKSQCGNQSHWNKGNITPII